MPLHRYDNRTIVLDDDLITAVYFYSDDGETVTMPLARLEELLYQAGYTVTQDNN